MPRKSNEKQPTKRRASASSSIKQKYWSSDSSSSDNDAEDSSAAEQEPSNKKRRLTRSSSRRNAPAAKQEADDKKGNTKQAKAVSNKKSKPDPDDHESESSGISDSGSDDDWTAVKRGRLSAVGRASTSVSNEKPKPKSKSTPTPKPIADVKPKVKPAAKPRAKGKGAKTKAEDTDTAAKKADDESSGSDEEDWIEVENQTSDVTANETDLVAAVNRLNAEAEGRNIELVIDPSARKVGNRLSQAELEKRRKTALQRALLDSRRKANFLCLIAIQQRALNVCQGAAIRAVALSLLPASFAVSEREKLHTITSLRKLFSWFTSEYQFETAEADKKEKPAKQKDGSAPPATCVQSSSSLRNFLILTLSTRRVEGCAARCAECTGRYALLFYTFLAALDWPVRLVCAFLPKTDESEALEQLSSTKRWLEVAVRASKTRFACVSPSHGVLDDVTELCRSTLPSSDTRNGAHVLAIRVGDQWKVRKPQFTMLDVTARYCPETLCRAALRARRLPGEWLDSIVTEPEPEELAEMQAVLRAQPEPASHADLKNHPLYVLETHVGKYQCIYDPDFAASRRPAASSSSRSKKRARGSDSDDETDVRECGKNEAQGLLAAPIGSVKNVPYFLRDFLHPLHTREGWLKEARVVRAGERPMKTVRGRQTKSCKVRGVERFTELYGEWQTDDYEPPVATDGRVPKNDFGNVYLFKPQMLPRGCVHLSLGNPLRQVARRLKIDVAPALTGWEIGRGGFNIPIYDGYIVCQEHAELLTDAYHAEIEAAEAKRRQRVREQWRNKWLLLVSGSLQRQRVMQALGHEPVRAGFVSSQEKETQRSDTNCNLPANSKYFPGKEDTRKDELAQDDDEEPEPAVPVKSWPLNRDFVGEARLSLFDGKKKVHDDLLDSDSD